ncbi:MAG: hypothetical protein KME11_05125 [Timaviella obliquedivisa GSE-PSE-MK23-08B]|jgi:hypothetical protein|nr:hypothetical protein [Timaviella obliquedivisa GSE-PSE-MK23-08B]
MIGSDQEIAFIFPVYDDYELVKRLVRQIRQHYLKSELFCISDGTEDASFTEFAMTQGVNYEQGDRLKLPQYGGQWVKRLINLSTQTKAKHIIRVEGDTQIWRRFKKFPAADVAGTIAYSHKIQAFYPRGGCVYFSRQAIDKLLESVLNDDRYKDASIYSYPRYSAFRYAEEPRNEQPILLGDLVLGDAIARSGLNLKNWSEVSIQFRSEPPDNADRKYAATHPHR